MKRYEGLFILNNTAKEDGIKETIDKISNEIVASGGKQYGGPRRAARPGVDARSVLQQELDATDMRQWRNPYIIVRADGVVLYDSTNNAEIRLKPEELLGALAKLPPANWPYGRVVAVQQNGVAHSKDDKVHMRRNRAVVAGTLESMKVLINWVPSA